LGTAGNDFEKYRVWLAEHGIATDSIQVMQDLPTAGAYVITDKDDNQITAFYPGASVHPYEKTLSADPTLAIVAPGNAADMDKLPEKFKAAGIPYFYDSGQQITTLSGEVLREAIPHAAALFGNDYEMALMMQKLGWSREELLRHVSIVVTTFGEKGSRVETPDAVYEIPGAPSSGVVDPTGAGDAYRAGFAKGFLHNLPLVDCARLGGLLGVYAVENYGTQNHRFTIEQLRARYQAAYGEVLSL
jgi:adenosine kinase